MLIKEKQFHLKILHILKKATKQRNRKYTRATKQDEKGSQRNKFEYNLERAKDISEFEDGYNIEYKTLRNIYPPEEAGVPQDELDYDYDIDVPVKVTRKDKLNMNQDDKNNMKRLITLLKKSHHNIDFHGEMPLGGKFYTIDVYLK